MARSMRSTALLVAVVVLAVYAAGAAAKKDKTKGKHHAPSPAPFDYTPAAEVLVQQAKAPGADGASYINAAKHVAPAPQVDTIIDQVSAESTPGEQSNLAAAQEQSKSNPNQAGR